MYSLVVSILRLDVLVANDDDDDDETAEAPPSDREVGGTNDVKPMALDANKNDNANPLIMLLTTAQM
jgi:hypothetical protein